MREEEEEEDKLERDCFTRGTPSVDGSAPGVHDPAHPPPTTLALDGSYSARIGDLCFLKRFPRICYAMMEAGGCWFVFTARGEGVLRSWACFGGRLLVGVYCKGGGSASLLGMLRRATSGGCLLQRGRERFALGRASAGGVWWALNAREIGRAHV